jgi:hypothetical protein|tara:strand:- start:466 stop:645 length:180 start_codon:yes stop_codon:yes gene_type:complete
MHDVWDVDEEVWHDAELGRQSSEKYEGGLSIESDIVESDIQRQYFGMGHVESDKHARFV